MALGAASIVCGGLLATSAASHAADANNDSDNPLRAMTAPRTATEPARLGKLQWRTVKMPGDKVDSEVRPVAASDDAPQESVLTSPRRASRRADLPELSDPAEAAASPAVRQNAGGAPNDPNNLFTAPAPGPAAAPAPAPGPAVAPPTTPPTGPATIPAPALNPAEPTLPGGERPLAPLNPVGPPGTQVPPMPLPSAGEGARKMNEAEVYDCGKAAAELKRKTLASIDLDITIRSTKGMPVPRDCRLATEGFVGRNWEQTDFVWTASGLCHKPLYFEEVQAERYGHSTGPLSQPFVSGAHFFGSILMLPYNMGLETPNECIYDLGYYRPGDCAPYMIPALPITARAVLFEAGTAAGLVYLLP